MPTRVETPTRFIFTKQRLDEAGPHRADSPSTELELCDVTCTGLRLMVSKGEPVRKRWSFRYRYRGRKYRISLGPYEGLSLKAARERVYELRTVLARGDDPGEYRRRRQRMPTFQEFTDTMYLPHARATVRTPKTIESLLRTGATRYFGARALDAITRRDVTFFLNEMKERTSSSTANYHLSILRRMLNLAIEWEILTKNPCLGVKKFQRASPRDRYLSKDELKRFIDASHACPSAKAASLFRLLLFSGLRVGEVVSLTFSQICTETKSVHLLRTKAGKSRRVYLSSHAWAEIERMSAMRREGNPHLFPSPRSAGHIVKPVKDFMWVLDQAKVSGFRVHDLRHTFASYMVQSGATLFEVQNALGHATSDMTQRYAHLLNSGVRARAEIAGDYIMTATQARVSETLDSRGDLLCERA